MPELEVRFGEPRDMPWKEVLPGNVLSAKTCCKCANEVAHPSPFLSQRLARQSPRRWSVRLRRQGPKAYGFSPLAGSSGPAWPRSGTTATEGDVFFVPGGRIPNPTLLASGSALWSRQELGGSRSSSA